MENFWQYKVDICSDLHVTLKRVTPSTQHNCKSKKTVESSGPHVHDKKPTFQDNHTHKLNHVNYCANCSCIIEITLYFH